MQGPTDESKRTKQNLLQKGDDNMPMCSSRKRTYSVMANSKFGDIVMTKGNYVVELPQEAMNKSTNQVKKYVQKQLDRINELTIAEVLHLQKTYGLGVTVK